MSNRAPKWPLILIISTALLLALIAILIDYGVLDDLGPSRSPMRYLHFILMLSTIKIYAMVASFGLVSILLVLYPSFVYSIMQLASVIGHRILGPAKLQARVYPKEPTRSSLRNLRILGLFLLGVAVSLFLLGFLTI